MRAFHSMLPLLVASVFAPVALGQAPMDFGDAPDHDGYATTLSKNGARHTIVPGFYLGLRVDAEPDGQPSEMADGDDQQGDYNDEDGVRFLSELTPGTTASVAVIASEPGFVSAWIDFEANKTWAEPGNRILNIVPVVAGVNRFTFPVPAGATPGPTYARFRLARQGISTFYGPAADGEVEDYRVLIRAMDFGDCPDAIRRPRAARMAAADGQEWDRLGDAVATDGDWLVAGGYGIGEGGVYGGTGGAYVFRWNGFEWVEFQKILASDGEVDDRFGKATAIRGYWMMVGATGRAAGSEMEAGAVYVFRWDGVQWQESQILTAGDVQRMARFGHSIALDGSRAAIGANYARTEYMPAGAAYIFSFDGSAWVQEARVAPSDGAHDDYFGSSLALDGNRLLIGAPQSDSGSITNTGSAYYFQEVAGEWQEKDKWVAADPESGDRFGTSVAIESGLAAVGASAKARYGINLVGAVYCYQLTGSGWEWIDTLHYDTDTFNMFGFAVAIRDGWLAVGAPYAYASDGRGVVCLYAWDGTGWRISDRFSSLPGADSERIGSALDLGGNWIASGVPATARYTGEAYTFEIHPYPYNYPTLYVNDGARHVINPAVRLGDKLDAEPDAHASDNAQGDDLHGDADEDGIVFITPLFPGREATIAAFPSVDGYLSGWIDFNDDGDWEDAHETIALGVPVTAGVSHVTFLVAPDAAPREQGRPLYARFRFSTEPVLSPGGEAPDGEVEDYMVYVEPFPDAMDFGDAPDGEGFAYRTLLANHGAWHAITPDGPWMGGKPDAEPDGLPSLLADGDNKTGTDDEDGVSFVTPLVRGKEASIKVDCSTSPRAGFLNAWIDTNRNGNWDDAGEQIIVDQKVAAGEVYTWSGIVPAAALVGPTYARFRICSAAGLPSYGPAVDGEVEDYALTILQAAPATAIVITDIRQIAPDGSIEVFWNAEPDVMYQLQRTTDLTPSHAVAWTDVGDLVLGPLDSQQDADPPDSCGFYRVAAPWLEGP